MSTDPRVETIRLLTSIDRNIAAIQLALVRILDAQGDREAGVTRRPPVNDRLCDGPHGDPVIKAKDPRDWTGEPMTGRRFSECPPEYLDLLAERYDYFVKRDTEALGETGTDDDPAYIAKLKKSIKYGTLDANRARAWAARLRAGYTAPHPDAAMKDAEPEW